MWSDSGYEPLPDQALRVRRLRSGVFVLMFVIVIAVLDGAMRVVFDIDLPIPPVVAPLVLAVALITAWWWWTRLSWQAWGWRLDEATFQTRSGVYTKVWKGVPRDRVQFVEVTAGPLQRSADLATLVVRTAGVRTPAVHVEDLHADVAERLRDELSPHATDESVPVRGVAPADPVEVASDLDGEADLDPVVTDAIVTERGDD